MEENARKEENKGCGNGENEAGKKKERKMQMYKGSRVEEKNKNRTKDTNKKARNIKNKNKWRKTDHRMKAKRKSLSVT